MTEATAESNIISPTVVVDREPSATIVSLVAKPISTESRRLDRTIGHLTAALGDPTRRAIYIAVRESAEPVTSASIAEIFGIHPNVARHHLDKLAKDGYLKVSFRRPSGRSGPGAGRPAKCYEPTGKVIDVHFPTKRYDVLVELLVRIIQRVAPEQLTAIAEEVGRDYGRELAAEIGAPGDRGYAEAIRAVAKALTGLGFAAKGDASHQRLVLSNCPFGEAATGYPEVVCSLDRGIVAGLFESLGTECEPVLHPHSEPFEQCVTEVPVAIAARG